MTKADFIAALATKTGVSKAEADNQLMAVFDTLSELLSKEDKFTAPGFGTFSTKIRAERKGRNPSNGEEITIARAIVVNFKPATQLKEKLNSDQ